MKNILIAKRYASAAVQSLNIDDYETILMQLNSFKKVLNANPEIKKIFSSSIITKQKKINFLQSIIDHLDNKEFWNQLINVIIMKNRGEIIDVFFDEFSRLLDERLNQKFVQIKLAHEHDEQTIKFIKDEVEKILKVKIVCDIEIDKEIIGGFIAKTDTQIIDASIHSNLQRFVKTMSKSYN